MTGGISGAAALPDQDPMPPSLIIEIVPMGNLANRIIQYLAAIEIQRRVPDAVLSGVHLPELGIETGRLEYDTDAADSLTLRDYEFLDVARVVLLQRRGAIRHVRLWNYCQRVDALPPLDVARDALAMISELAGPVDLLGDDVIVVNIRAAEILTGVIHYPLLPIGFYQDVVARSGRRPVFLGQIDDSDYCRALRAAFPDAEFRTSQGALRDFETMRCCSHLVLSISTFTWLAGWLSSARTIVLPMAGLFNRSFLPDTDLLPLGDERYAFWSFPTYFGMPSPEFLRFEHRLAGTWRRDEPAAIADMLRRRAGLRSDVTRELEFLDPFMAAIFHTHDLVVRPHDGVWNHFFERIEPPTYRIMNFDEYFYCHQYLDAGRAIADGICRDGFDHYVRHGSALGYLPRQIDHPNISRGKPARLSSVATPDAEGTADAQAMRAIDDPVAVGASFRTRDEDAPWWMVDLGGMHEITDMFIHNRDDALGHAAAATPLDIELSEDGAHWTLLHRCASDRPFGDNTRTEMLRWYPRPSVAARFVRLIVRRRTTLHLRAIEIYGRPLF